MVVGLHSQSLNNSDGFVSGSEITTGYLTKAFQRLIEPWQVLRFSPGQYNGLSSQAIDLMLIEGWHPELPYFVELTRKFHPNAKIIFWNLSFYGFNGVLKLDVDGFLSNSIKNSVILNHLKPSKYVMLAADTLDFQRVDNERNNEVVYLGLNNHKSEEIENLILHEAKGFNLSIYGSGWENHPEMKVYWRGKLPREEISQLYLSSNVVLGMTEERQSRAGMINNRVFEALSCGTLFISEYFSELENVFGDLIFYSRESGDTKATLELLLRDNDRFHAHRKRAMAFIREHHTYDHRVKEILNFYTTLI